MKKTAKREKLEKQFFDYINRMTEQERIDFLYIVKAGMSNRACLDAALQWSQEQRRMGRMDSLVAETADFVRQYLGVTA